MKTHLSNNRISFLLVASLIFVGACGDGSKGDGIVVENCERLEREEFDDCTVEGVQDPSENGPRAEGMNDFCASPCNSVELLNLGYKDYRNLSFMRGTEELVRGLALRNNPHLENFEGMEDLVVSGEEGNHFIEENPELKNFKGLESLQELRDGATINGNGLESMDGLESLEVIEGRLQMQGNDDLTSLRGLESLERIGTDLDIRYNESLPECEVDWLSERVEVEGKVRAESNGPSGDEHCDD